jgi:hypothetical protein
MDRFRVALYRVSMDQLAREDIAAAAAAHHDLGPEYDAAVAEGLVERIGSEIDKRVDARLDQRSRDRQIVSRPIRSSHSTTVLGLGSMGIGVGGAAVLLSVGSHLANASQIALIALIWIIIGIINVAYSRRH